MPSERVQRRIDSLLDEADAAVADARWDRVRQLCDTVLRLDPDNEDARTFLEAADRDPGVLSAPRTPAPSTAPAPPDTPEHDTPESFAGGRYEVRRFLGEGGKKRVYLAHDTTLDREVAFALIKTDGFDDVARQRITRTSSRSTTWARKTISRSWCCRSCPAAMSKG